MSDWIGVWPLLSQIGLSADAIAGRVNCIGGSDANTIMSGDDQRVIDLWQQKRGEIPPTDLSRVLPVMLGSWTEPFHRMWYMQETGLEVTDAGAVLTCPTYDWRTCSLDGLVNGAIWEAKHVGAFSKPDEILTRYMPQLQHNMAVVGAERAILSVIYGNNKWETYEIGTDWLYQDQLLEAEQAFWACIKSGEPPAALPAPAGPKPLATREISFEGNNSWSAHAADWIANAAAAKKHKTATESIKELIEDDVSRAYGHGIEAKRSKAGAITIREVANA